MMQVEPMSSPELAPASTAIPAATSGSLQASSSVESSASCKSALESDDVPENTNQITKQAITPLNLLKLKRTNGNVNLLKFLNGSTKTGVFKTIGDRIVVPMKLSNSSKKLLPMSGSRTKASTTFRMAIPSSKDLIRTGTENRPFGVDKLTIKQTNSNESENLPSVLTTKNIKTEFKPEPFSENGDLNKFMNSVSRSVLYPIKNNDYNNPALKVETKNEPSVTRRDGLKLDEDEELTCLSWLSSDNKELLRTIRKCNPDDPGIGLSGDENEDETSNVKKLIFTASSRINSHHSSSGQSFDDFKYNPLCKPPYSFSCLIFMAIEDSYLKRLPVKEIYNWVCKHFPYFRSAPSGWKNSIRHNLSLNRCFKKADCSKFSAKGSLWCIDPAYRPNLVQALKRSPYYPYLHPTGMGQPLSLNNLANLLPGAYTGRIPSWTPSLPPSTLWADRDMASAALNLMGLRGSDSGATNNTELISNTLDEIFRDADWLSEDSRRQRCDSTESVGSEELVISGNAQDHTYTRLPPKKKNKREEKRCKSPQSDKSAPDAAYEFESAELSDDFADDGSDWIVEDVVIDDKEECEEQSLFDSGFGSMKSFKLRDDPKRKTATSSKTEKSKMLQNKALNKAHSRSLRNNPIRSTRRPTQRKSKALSVRIKPPCPKPKAQKSSKDKCSDVDSGKDSPKVIRKSRSRCLKQRSLRNNSKYHTRSSGCKLLGQTDEKHKFSIRKRKRRLSIRSGAVVTDEDEEIKLAAGSLMRLAGLLHSPTSSPSKRGK